MKSFLLASATLVLSASLAFGDDPCNLHPLRPDGRKNCLEIGAAVLKTSMDDMFAKDSAKIDAARKRYFALWPNGPGIDQAERDFLRALRQKDAYYLALSTSTVMNMVLVKAGNALAVLGGDSSLKDLNKVPDNMDGGIRPYARPLFARWVAAMRRAEDKKAPSGSAVVDGAQNLMQFVAKMLNDPSANPSLLIDTLQDESNWRTAYEDARNWAELMSSGLNLSRLIPPDIYIRSQMEADVSWSLGQNKQDDLPDPVAATLDVYNLFVKMFGEKEVLAAANATLQAPKNSVGGLATRSPVEIGEFVASPSPNPYYLFLSQVTKSSPRAYAIALAFDPNTLLTMQPAAAFNMKVNWQKANSVYTQLVAKYGEANVLAAAGRLRDTPKNSEGRIAGDQQSQPLRVWFQALLKNSNAAIPDGQVAHFRASSYDPRWVGKPVIVRGTVAGVDVDTRGMPHYATIRFKDSRPDGFVGFSPYPDMLQSSYGDNFGGLIGKTIEVQGDVQSFGEGAGVRILSLRQLKVLDAGALANFRESTPDWLKLSTPAANLVDSPKYLAWKKFPTGSKASYDNSLLHEYQPGTNQYTRTKISHDILTLVSIDGERAIVKAESTLSGKIAGRNGPDTSSGDQLIFKAKQAAPGAQVDDPSRTITSGEETLTVNGKKIATRWECVTRAGDPMTFTKTWTSDDVPGGLVRTQQQSHSQITGQTYRDIQQTLLAPIDGVDAQLGDATSSAPSPAGPTSVPVSRGMPGAPAQPAPALAAPPPSPGRQYRSVTSTAGQPEFMTHYGAVMRRAAQTRFALAQAQRKSSATGVPIPDDIRAAQERLPSQQQAANLAIRTRDYAAGEQSLRAMEDTLVVIEDFVAKAGTTVNRGNPQRR
jgi:hypothetical protein